MFTSEIIPYTLRFKRPAGTSRGVYREHRVWYAVLRDREDPDHFGIGECAPLPGLSCDYNSRYEETLSSFCRILEERQQLDIEPLRSYPSILFGLESALQHYQQRSWQLRESPFSRGVEGIAINGLIWMGNIEQMRQQAERLLQRGFSCIKLKIGAIAFEEELRLLRDIRIGHPGVTLRVDANGAFTPDEAEAKLQRLTALEIHSIEQPIRAGQREEMARLCGATPLPIALDEELIGICHPEEKRQLLETTQPQYIILKPSLHGGISGCTEWIALANELGIGWWITSALESNIGLNSIAQWCATLGNPLPQGLGTGSLYQNNLPLPLAIRGDALWFNPSGPFPDKPLQAYETDHD